MRKRLLLAVFLLIFVYACQPKTDAMQKPSEIQTQQPAAESTGDSATDSFGNDMNNANNEDRELSSSELEGMDSGFSDVENI